MTQAGTPGDGDGTRAPVRFSVVSAVHDVRRYLDEFIDSWEHQTVPRESFEVVAVDDGSHDDSLERLRRWERDRPGLVRVLTKPNGGQGSARNLGLTVARGEWVTFTDPDDTVAPDYLERVAAFLDAHPETDMVATNRLSLDDATGELTASHPLRAHFYEGDRLRHLEDSADYFHGSAPAAFVRRARVEELDLRFDERVRPNFEDGHFCVSYLLGLEDPTVGFVQSAKYHYRRRADASSTLQTSKAHRGRYTDVLRHGYLDVLRRSAALRGGEAAPWLQAYVVYELSWYLSSYESNDGIAQSATGEVADEFHALMIEVTAMLAPEVVEGMPHRGGLRPEWRDVLLHAYQPEPWHEPVVRVTGVDPDQRLVRLSYHFTGPLPREAVVSGGREVAPRHAKIRDLFYHDRVLLQERVLWVPTTRSVRIRLDGKEVGLLAEPRPAPPRRLTRMALGELEGRVRERKDRATAADKALVRLAASPPVRRLFKDAWVLMDRIHDADDNAERLFEYLRSQRRDINAWFVLEKGTPHWERMRKAGYKRLVPFGSLQWKLLMLNCRHLVSSHADDPVVRPPALAFLKEPTWRFTFLQHGVIKDDISVWLNRKPIKVFVTSTPGEYASIAGDHTTYHFTTKEAVLTGLPRFDRLREIGRSVAKRDLVLIAPTWRRWLFVDGDGASQRRSTNQEFLDSEFVRQWMAVLRSEELRLACERHGLKVGFLPHPNLQGAAHLLDVPPHVELLSFEDGDVQHKMARAAAMVTDYSSMAFNVAYLDRPVVYFQFDEDAFLGGEHVGRAGYFTYRKDGFGPVETEADEAVKRIVEVLDAGGVPPSPYAERVAAAFPQRDGRCCERVTDAILASERPWRGGAVPTPVPPPRVGVE